MTLTLATGGAGGATTSAMSLATPSMYWACALLATGLGASLALLDLDEVKKGSSGNSPAAHVSECADSADLLLSDMFGDGAGLGLLEPLWRLFTPDGALWTLLTGWAPRDSASHLGLAGLLAAIGSLAAAAGGLLGESVEAFGRLVRPRRKGKKGAKDEGAEGSTVAHEKINMTFVQEIKAYYGYARLFVLGVFREYVVRARAAIWRDEVSRRYITRERWSTGWVDFYLQHMYKLYVDCFGRPIASAPDACVDVIMRSRPGGVLFGPLHDFVCTERVLRCVNLASYNYLGFGGVDEFCTPAAKAAVMEHGWSTCTTRTEGGTVSLHRELEREVAEFLSKEDAVVLGMGFATNSTILPALFEAGTGTGVLVLSDELNHRSIVEGVRLSGATVRAFAHNSMPALERELRRAIQEGQPTKTSAAPDGEAKKPSVPWRKIFVVVEGIYSMEGDFCKLREIVTLKNRYGAYLYLDEAHSIGAVGPTGRGVTELLGVPTSEVDVMMGTFTKSFGSAGGYVAASKEVISALRRNAPGSTFAGAMAPPCAAQALVALRMISGKEGGSRGAEKLASIRDNSNFFRKRLAEVGFKVIGDEDSPIVPVMVHHPTKLAELSRICLELGTALVAVGNPAVPLLYERVRFCISAAHTRDQLEKAIQQLVVVGAKLGVLYDRGVEKSEREARAARLAEYSAWLHNAPLETRTWPPPLGNGWSPEPLAPTAATCSLLARMEEMAATPQESTALDFRPLNPLGYRGPPTPAVQKATEATMAVFGFGACGPRGFYGTTVPHLEMEAALAKFLGLEACIAYSAGVTVASSVLPALVQPGDRVVVDHEAHLGIRTGLRLCKAEITWVPHNDLAAIEDALAKGSSKGRSKGAQQRRTFLVVEALCQRSGKLAPLKELVALKERYGALLVLDEALTFGAIGETGRGLCEVHGLASTRVDAIMGSLENALAGVGGFCAGRRGLVEHQRLAGAGYCFSASCPPSACSAATASLGDLSSADGIERRKRVSKLSALLHAELSQAVAESKDAGTANVELSSSPESFVQVLRWNGSEVAELGAGEELLLAVAAHCAAAGVQVQVCSPTRCGAELAFNSRLAAPTKLAAGLRVCVSAGHSEEDVRKVAETLKGGLCKKK